MNARQPGMANHEASRRRTRCRLHHASPTTPVRAIVSCCTTSVLLLLLLLLVASAAAAGATDDAGGSHSPAPPQSPCPSGCSGRGNCNLDTNTCECPFGFRGADCAEAAIPACRADPHSPHLTCDLLQRRPLSCECLRQCRAYLCHDGACSIPFNHNMMSPCFERNEAEPEDQYSVVPHLNDTRYSWYSVPFHEMPGMPPEEVLAWKGQVAVPLERCMKGCHGRGWCMEVPGPGGIGRGQAVCSCFGGWTGQTCGQADTATCLNNCTGRGTCHDGFCRCSSGFFGRDCSRDKGGFQQPEGWPMTRGGPTGDAMRVFIYELPQWLAQHQYTDHDPNYAAEEVFSQALYKDWRVRTQNPYEATLFFIPAKNMHYSSNLADPNAHMHAVLQYIRTAYVTFWNATGGRDHFFWITGDRNNCHFNERDAPGISAPIRLTHFGLYIPRAGPSLHRHWMPAGGLEGCFQPARDIVAAPYHEEDYDGTLVDHHLYKQWLREYHDWRGTHEEARRHKSLMARITYKQADRRMGHGGTHAPPAPAAVNFTSAVDANRTVLLLFAGSVRREDPLYSGGSRAALLDAVKGNPAPDLKVVEGRLGSKGSDYLKLMWRSKFCFVSYGHGWGIRLRLVAVRGCIPVIVQDSVLQYYEDLLPYHHFSLRYRTQDMPTLVARLRAIPPERVKLLQLGLRRYHRAFFWTPEAPVHGLAYNYTLFSLHSRLRNLVAGYY